MTECQVFYEGEHGEVLAWDGQSVIKPGVNYCVTISDDYGSTVEVFSPEYHRGYKNAISDVLNEIRRSGKQNLVQWLEDCLKVLP